MRPNWFVGLPVAPHQWHLDLLATAPADVRRTHPDDLHITVAFLGGVDATAAENAWAMVLPDTAPAITVTLAGLAALGNQRRPTALSVLLGDGRSETAALISRLAPPMCRAAGVAESRYAVKPHVTVARPARNATAAERARAVAWATEAPEVGATVTLDRIALYTWSEDRQTRKFRMVRHQSLAGASR